ncbi:MAG: MFS transporter [Chloroflexota bacterium]|nr:MFS transporter [Chloroflexota bacterium]
MDKKRLYIFCFAILPLMICSGIVYSVLALFMSEELSASRTQIGLIYMTGALAGAIVAPFVGSLSDRIGRRPILLVCMASFVGVFALYALVGDVVQAFPVQAVEGGIWAALGPVAMAYVTDIVPSEHRGWALGMYERTWFIGWIIGPALGGLMADTIGFRTTFLVGSALVIAGLAFMWRYVKEQPKA